MCALPEFRGAIPSIVKIRRRPAGDQLTVRLPWGALDIEGIIRRADIVVAPDGMSVRFVNAADLVVMRRAVGRPKDLRRADELEAQLHRARP